MFPFDDLREMLCAFEVSIKATDVVYDVVVPAEDDVGGSQGCLGLLAFWPLSERRES